MAAFPTLSSTAVPDSSQFAETQEDPALRTQLEGGYVASRPKHTRTPRRNWQVAYRNLSNADKTLIQNHVTTQRGGSLIFDWTNPQNSTVYQVRYKTIPTWSYTGAGNTQRWDCSFELEQA